MKRILNFMMNNSYFIIVFSIVVFSLRLLLDGYAVPDNYLSLFSWLKTIFLVVFSICFLYVVSFFVFALVTKNKSEAWWDNLEKGQKGPEKDKFLKTYLQGLVVSIPLAVYGSLVYLAAFASWQSILTFVIVFAINRLINFFKNRRKPHLPQNL